MIGTTLDDVRDHIEALSSADGDYYLVCGRSGDRPVPAAAGLRFGSRLAARAASRATEQYRRYDPQLPVYDVIVCQDAAPPPGPSETPPAIGPPGSDRTGDGTAEATDERPALIEFCHLVAGAVFETVAVSAHRDVERKIMDTYLESAEMIGSPDDLCLRLLESTATELDRQLSPTEQARVIAAAAARLPPPPSAGRPLEAALSRLCAVALADDYALVSAPEGRAATGSWKVTLTGYAPAGDRLVTLPLAVELFRRALEPIPAITGAERGSERAGRWSFRLTTAPGGEPAGLAVVKEGER